MYWLLVYVCARCFRTLVCWRLMLMGFALGTPACPLYCLPFSDGAGRHAPGPAVHTSPSVVQWRDSISEVHISASCLPRFAYEPKSGQIFANASLICCQRCHRLDKPCSSQTPAPPRKRKEPKPTRVAELERKLEDLTARLESAAGAGANQSQGRSPSRGLSEEAVQDNHRTTIAGSSQPLVNANTWDISQPTAATNGANHNGNNPTIDYNFAHIFGTDGPLYNQVELPPSTPSTHLKDSSSLGSSRSNELRGGQPPSPQVPPHITTPKPLLWPEDAEAEAMLTLYQATLAHHFPFTPIDPRLSSRELRQKRPFVWKAAMMSAYHLDGPRQTALGNQLLKEIIEAAMVSAQKDLDLLQGLQLLICWYHYNLKSSQLTNLVFLARSICSSLGLTESTHLNSVKGRLDQFTPKCLDNMRALTGTYYITTV